MTAVYDDDMGDVVPLHPDLDAEVVDEVEAPGVAVEPWQTSRARESVASLIERRSLPSRHQAVASAKWWSRHLLRLTPMVPVLVLAEIRPILRGIGRVWSVWSAWVSLAAYAETVRAADGKDQHKAQEKIETRKSARAKLSLGIAVVLVGTGTWVVLAYPLAAAGVAVLLVAVFDAIGRRRTDVTAPQVVLPQGPIGEGMPLSSLRAEISQSLDASGDEVTVAMPHPVENGWTVDYHSTAEIGDDHMRQLERDLNIRRGGITQIVERGHAARGQLQVMIADPLAKVLDSPEPDGLTIFRPLPLGRTASGEEWAEHFLRTHFTVIGASQSGKSSCLWQVTDVLRRCPEVELDAIDLTEGPAFGASRRAFRKRAFDEEAAEKVLMEAKALCKTRNAELQRLAEADDTPDDYEEKWQPTPEKPQRVVLIDEFARISDVPELLKLVEYLLRYGAKAAVTVGIAGQGATLEDFGTKTVRAQVMLKILFACDKGDVLALFGPGAAARGYRPDLFEPATGQGPNDAGKAYVTSATSKTPEPRRAFRLEQHEVRRRDRELGTRPAAAELDTVDAVEVPQILADFQAAFEAAGRPAHLPTADLIAGRGWSITAKGLSNKVKPYGLAPDQHPVSKARGYYLADLEKALGDL